MAAGAVGASTAFSFCAGGSFSGGEDRLGLEAKTSRSSPGSRAYCFSACAGS